MFVSKDKYIKAQAALRIAELGKEYWSDKYDGLLKEWNALIRRINAKGGEAFLNGANQPRQFTQGDIQKLIQLCHPDKHGDSRLATEMTQRLLQLKK